METIYMEQSFVEIQNQDSAYARFPISALVKLQGKITNWTDAQVMFNKIIETNLDTKWLKYLYANATITHGFIHARSFVYDLDGNARETVTWETVWELPPQKQNYFLLAYGEEYRKMKYKRFA